MLKVQILLSRNFVVIAQAPITLSSCHGAQETLKPPTLFSVDSPPLPLVAKCLQTDLKYFRIIYGVTDTDFNCFGINYGVTDTDLAF